MKITRYRSGFTLMELLVVVAVIGVLAALLFSVFFRARKGARVVTCLSNLRQLGAATQMYQGDFDGKLPLENPRSHVIHDSNGPSVSDPLVSYGMTQNLFHCPEAASNSRLSQGSSDYTVRFVIEPQREGATEFESWRVEPQASTVIAFCRWHLDNPDRMLIGGNGFYTSQGNFQVLRGDGSVQKIQSSQVQSKPFGKGYDPNVNAYALFPNEVWPLTLTRIK